MTRAFPCSLTRSRFSPYPPLILRLHISRPRPDEDQSQSANPAMLSAPHVVIKLLPPSSLSSAQRSTRIPFRFRRLPALTVAASWKGCAIDVQLSTVNCRHVPNNFSQSQIFPPPESPTSLFTYCYKLFVVAKKVISNGISDFHTLLSKCQGWGSKLLRYPCIAARASH